MVSTPKIWLCFAIMLLVPLPPQECLLGVVHCRDETDRFGTETPLIAGKQYREVDDRKQANKPTQLARFNQSAFSWLPKTMFQTVIIRVILIVSLLLSCGAPVQAQRDAICPRVKSTNMDKRLKIQDPHGKNFREISGLGFSLTYKGTSGQPLIYVISDGGGGKRLGVFDSGNGIRVLTFRLPRSLPENRDFESMSVGSCGTNQSNQICIYVADVGDNNARRSGGIRTGLSLHNRTAYSIYKITEPDPRAFNDNDILPESYVTTLNFNYFHSSSPTRYADCEAVFVDSVGWGDGGAKGDLYLATKWSYRSTNTRLFKIPAQVWNQAKNNKQFVYSPKAVGDYSNGINSNAVTGHRWTRGEMTRDGTLIVLGDTRRQYLHVRCPGTSVAEALAVKGTKDCIRWPVGYENGQFETFAFSPNGAWTLELSECSSSKYCTSEHPNLPMVITKLDYDSGRKIKCESRGLPTASDCPSVLRADEKLYADKKPSFICSPNGKYRFGFNDEGELALWQQGNTKDMAWTAEACCKTAGAFVVMQGSDGNLVLRGNVVGNPRKDLWASRTANPNNRGARLSIEDDGHARIRLNGKKLWSTENDSRS